MSLERVCYRCGTVETYENPLESNTRIAGGVELPSRDFCADEDACMARRFVAPRSYQSAHAAVLAFRKKALGQ